MIHDRRGFLKRGGALAALATSGFAGCLGNASSVIGGGASVSARGKWLYEPGTVYDVDHYAFFQAAPKRLDEHEDALDDDLFDAVEALEQTWEFADADFDEVKSYLRFGGSAVLETTLDARDIVDELDDNDFDDEDEYEGYQIFVHDDEAMAAAVKGGTVVIGQRTREESAEDVVTETIDAAKGDTDRYTDEVEAMALLSDQLGDGDIVYGRTHEETDEVASDVGRTISAGSTVQGEITEDDPFYPDSNYYYDGYSFHAEAGTELTATMTSEEARPLVALELPDGSLGPTGNPVRRTETESSSTSTARTYTNQVTHTVQETGIYRLVATSWRRRKTLSYALTLDLPNGGGGLGPFEAEVARGSVLTLGAETTERSWVFVFDGDDADEGDLEDWASDDPVVKEYDEVGVSVTNEGRVGVVSGHIDTDDVVHLGLENAPMWSPSAE